MKLAADGNHLTYKNTPFRYMLLVDSYQQQDHDVFYTSADGCGIFVYISAGSPSHSLRQVVLYWFN